eukprot:8536673-Karenia_brevis.AAC.1
MARTEVEAKRLAKVVRALATASSKVSLIKWKGTVSWSWLPIARVNVDAQHEAPQLQFNEINLQRSGINKDDIRAGFDETSKADSDMWCS